VVPFSTSPFTGPAISGGQTITVNGNIDRSVPSISLGGNNTLAIRGTGRLRLYSGGETRFSGNSRVTMTADPAGSPLSVELYCNGDIFLNSVINQPGNPVNFSVYGTPNCRAMDFVGNDAFIGTLYAPSADARLRGNGGFSGAIVAGSIWHNGTADFHYDEALAGVRAPFPVGYRVRVWREL
jgi:hypothetical protein